MHSAAVLPFPFPTARAREAAAVRQAVRLRGLSTGVPVTAIEDAAHAAVAALLRERCSGGWAVHVGCRALRGAAPALRAIAP